MADRTGGLWVGNCGNHQATINPGNSTDTLGYKNNACNHYIIVDNDNHTNANGVTTMSKGIEILFDSNRGQYIPQAFAEGCDHWSGITGDQFATLATGPDGEWYWETWETVQNNAFCIDERGYRWTLYQDGDLFATCDALMTEEERANFFDL